MLRFIYIFIVLLKYGCIVILMKLGLYRKPKEKLFKQFFEDAGGSFIKFGQLLSLRVDILPKEYSHEMLDLLDNVNPFPYSQVKEVFIQELGATPEKIFYDFQPEPFASGSFGQVHAAKLDKETIVAVKILRPNIEETVNADFIVIDVMAFFADIFFKIAGLSWKEFASEFKTWTLQELDYHLEAEHAERMYQNNKKDQVFVIPKIYHRYSTKRILVQEYIEGYHLSRVLRGLRDGRLDHDKLLRLGVDMSKIPQIITQGVLKQYFFYGFFHADLHPGNMILLKGNKVALIDFGITGEWIPTNHESLIHFMQSVGKFNFKEATYYFSDIVGTDLRQLIESAFPASTDQKQIDEFMHILADHFSESVEKTVRGSILDLRDMKKDYSTMLMQILQASSAYKIKIPKETAIFLKTISTLGILCKQMDPDYRLQKEVKRFFEAHPFEEFPENRSRPIPKRISRERALERLNSWLAYLFEKDPAIYKLVNTYISQYNKIDR